MFYTDPALDQLIRLARNGDFDGRIWVTVAGATIAGRLVEWEQFRDRVPPWVYERIYQELESETRIGVGHIIKTIELLDVRINGDSKPWARVMFAEVVAWGIETTNKRT